MAQRPFLAWSLGAKPLKSEVVGVRGGLRLNPKQELPHLLILLLAHHLAFRRSWTKARALHDVRVYSGMVSLMVPRDL